MRRQEHIIQLSRAFQPAVWSFAERAFSMQGLAKAMSDWPAHCYYPIRMAQAAIDVCASLTNGQAPELIRTHEGSAGDGVSAAAMVFSGLFAWEATKGVYRFDETVEGHLDRSVFDAPLSLDALAFLPEPCVYIERAGDVPTCAGVKQFGFYAFIDHDPSIDHSTLVFLVDCSHKVSLQPILISLSGEHALGDMIDDAVEDMLGGLRVGGAHAPRADMAEAMLHATACRKLKLQLLQWVGGMLSSFVYLCSRDAQIETVDGASPRWPGGKDAWCSWGDSSDADRTREQVRHVVANGISLHRVGSSLGQSIREAYHRSDIDRSRLTAVPSLDQMIEHVRAGTLDGPMGLVMDRHGNQATEHGVQVPARWEVEQSVDGRSTLHWVPPEMVQPPSFEADFDF